MPVDRSYIETFALEDGNAYLALTALADHGDALEQAAGILLGAAGPAQAAPPAAAAWTITAVEGHFVVQITNPQGAAAVVQHQIRSAVDQNFNANSGVATFTLGLGETTRDIVDPNASRYWQIRSRYQGSGWNGWASYTTSYGVVVLNAGPLRTS